MIAECGRTVAVNQANVKPFVRLHAPTGRVYFQNVTSRMPIKYVFQRGREFETLSGNQQSGSGDLVFEQLCGFHLTPDWAQKSHFSGEAHHARQQMRLWASRSRWQGTLRVELDPLIFHYHETLAPDLERKSSPAFLGFIWKDSHSGQVGHNRTFRCDNWIDKFRDERVTCRLLEYQMLCKHNSLRTDRSGCMPIRVCARLCSI